MNSEYKTIAPSNKDSEHYLRAFVGVSMAVDDDTYQKIISGDTEALQTVLLGKAGRVSLDGKTYFPTWARENREITFDFYMRRTPLHSREERTPRQAKGSEGPAPLNEKISGAKEQHQTKLAAFQKHKEQGAAISDKATNPFVQTR